MASKTAVPPASAVKPSVSRPNSFTILNCRLDKVSREETLRFVERFLAEGGVHQLVTANPIMLMAAQQDEALRTIFSQASLVIPESVGVAWASAYLGTSLEEIVPGIDLFQDLCRQAAETGRSVFLLGAKPGVAEKAASTLTQRFPGLRVAGVHHGYAPSEEEPALISRIRTSAPDFLFVAMGVPGQEKWIHRHLSRLGVPVVMGVGGSFDVLSGNLRRAPFWMRRARIEWIFRTLQEPWRWKRLMDLPVFACKVVISHFN